jgi:hypothetical protein
LDKVKLKKESAHMNSHGSTRRSRRRVLGTICYLSACVLGGISVAVALASFDRQLNFLAGIIIAVLLLVVTLFLLIFAERFFVPNVADVLNRDHRSPVVFLRPFGEDEAFTYDVIATGESITTITAKAEDFLLSLNAVGPLVSIAEPNRWARMGMHPHGVYRDFIGEGDWQARVQMWLDQAGMVVLVMGDSPGIEWEIEQVRQRFGPQSLLLYLSPRPANAFTRKGRLKKEKSIYERFSKLVEKHFAVTMPPFTKSTYLIGFDTDGTPVMAPDAPGKRWVFTEHGRVAEAIRSQLRAVLAKVRPGTRLDTYRIVGRTGMWWRIIVVTTLMLATIGLGLADGPLGELLRLAVQAFPGLILTGSWVLLAIYFKKPWVWTVPVLLGILLALSVGVPAYAWFNLDDRLMILRAPWYNILLWLLRLAYAGTVLALGVVLIGRQATYDA